MLILIDPFRLWSVQLGNWKRNFGLGNGSCIWEGIRKGSLFIAISFILISLGPPLQAYILIFVEDNVHSLVFLNSVFLSRIIVLRFCEFGACSWNFKWVYNAALSFLLDGGGKGFHGFPKPLKLWGCFVVTSVFIQVLPPPPSS